MKVKLLLSYDGTDYNGFQYQPDVRTVQGTLENALSKLTDEKVKITGCSRTDSGVHANFQVATFETESKIPSDKYSLAIKPYLPKDLNVYNSTEVDIGFHPSRDALAKMYTYLISTGKVIDIRKKRYSYQVREHLDIKKIQLGCQSFEGTKDFKSFCAAGSQVKTTERTILKCRFDHFLPNEFKFTIIGDGFLYKMVRIIVATLIQVGLGNIELEQLEEIISMKDRLYAPYTAPSLGLCLEKIWYNKEILENTLTK